MKSWIKRFPRVLEIPGVLLLIGVALWTVSAFYGGIRNTNDFRLQGNPDIRAVSANSVQFSGIASNRSTIPLKDISVTVDAYDGSERILGTGIVFPESGGILGPAQSFRFTVHVTTSTGCRAVRKFMVIPHSSEGTGKLTTIFVPAL